MRADNGPEFVSQAILEWIASAGIATVLNDPGKPWQKGADESFNGKFRDECALCARREVAPYPNCVVVTTMQHVASAQAARHALQHGVIS